MFVLGTHENETIAHLGTKPDNWQLLQKRSGCLFLKKKHYLCQDLRGINHDAL